MSTTGTASISVREFCRRHGVHRATFYRWLKADKGPPVIKMGPRLTRIRLADEEAWLLRHREAAQ